MLGQAEVIECWDEGFKQLEVGAKAKFECPASMAYGNVMKKGIPENSDLEFDVELLACAKDEMGSIDQTQLASLAAIADEENGAQENIEVA